MRIALTTLLAAGLLSAANPAAAQDRTDSTAEEGAGPTGPDLAAAMKSMFTLEPLTLEQQARLPQAQALVARIMPPGTMQEMMGGMYDKLLGPIMSAAGEPGSSDVARELGLDPEEIELEGEDAASIAAMLDPAWKERREAEMATVRRITEVALGAMEPSMRKGMAEAYAAAFSTAELTDIASFFATPSGASFARKSYALASDPRIIAAAMEGFPALMGQMAALEVDVKAATASLPPRRGYGDLTAAERQDIARLTGLTQADIQAGMARAEDEREKKHADEDEMTES